MPTGRLGTSDSQLGNIVLGSSGAAPGETRTISDTLSTSDTLAASGVYARGIGDTVVTHDSIASESSGAQIFTRTAVDSTSSSDAVTRLSAVARSLSDEVAVTDGIGVSRLAIRTATDSVITGDTISTFSSGEVTAGAFDPDVFDPDVFNTIPRRALFETLAATDSVAYETTGVRGSHRAPVDSTPTSTEAPARFLGLTRVSTEQVATVVVDSIRDAGSIAVVTQSGAEALVGVPLPGAIITQSGAEAIVQFPPPPMRVSKVGAQAMVRTTPHIRATQVSVQVVGRPDTSWIAPAVITAEDSLTTAAEETFTRVEVGGWGESEFGTAWEVQRGLPATFSVTNGLAQLAWRSSAPSTGDAIQARLPFSGAYPIDITIDFLVKPSDNPNAVYSAHELYWEIYSSSNHAIWGFEFDAYRWDQYIWGNASVITIHSGQYPDHNSGDDTPAELEAWLGSGAPSFSTIKQRVRIEEFSPGRGTVSVKLWLEGNPEPEEWWVVPWVDMEATFDWWRWASSDYVFYGPWSPAGLRFVANNRTATTRTSIEIDRIVFNSGLSSAVDSIEHEVAEGEYPGTLREFLSTTESISFLRVSHRTVTDNIPTTDWIHRVPNAEEIEELGILPGYYLYDFFERDMPESQLGSSSSGWPYPNLAGSSGGTSGANAPLFIISNGMFGMGRGAIWPSIPSAPRVGIRFDYFVPVLGRQAEVIFSGERSRQDLYVYVSGTGADLGRWLNVELPTTSEVYGYQYLVFDLDGADSDLRGQWLRILAVYPERIGEIYGLKVWLADEPEPEAWNQVRVETGLSNWAQLPQIAFAASWGTTSPPEAERAGLVVDNLQIFDPLPYMPGGTTEYIRILPDTVSATHWHHPDDFYTDAQDSVATWVPDMIMHRVERPQIVQPIENGTTLAEDADPGDLTIVVTDPTGTGGTAPIIIVIGSEHYEVIAANGAILTLDRAISRPYATGTPVTIRPVPTSIVVGGVDITRFVDFKATRLTTYAAPQVGTGEIRIKDVDRTRTIIPGSEVIVRHRGIRVWGGFVKQVQRSYAFPYGRSGAPAPRFLTLQVVDYNILFETRVLYNKVDPPDYEPEPWPEGTSDATAIMHMIYTNLDLSGDGLGYDIAVTTTIAPFEKFTPATLDGTKWSDGMNRIVDHTRAVYYIDPDKIMRYVDDSTQQSRFGYDGVSDVPDGTTTIGYREMELDSDATQMVNDVMIWSYAAAGQYTTEMAFHREIDQPAINTHGRWQLGERRSDMYKQASVQRRAETWIHGSAFNRRGHKDDRYSVRCVVFVPYFRVGDVVNVEITSFGFEDLIPVRGADITFPTPFDIEVRLTISHEIDPPWATFEFVPLILPDLDPPISCPIDIVPQYEAVGPGLAWTPVPAPAGQNDWLVYTSHYKIGAGPGGDWIWIASEYVARAYMGHYYIESPTYRFAPRSTYYQNNGDGTVTTVHGVPTRHRWPILNSFTSVSSGYFIYGFGSAGPWIVWEPTMLETRSWQRISASIPGWSGMIEVTLTLHWQFEGWNKWSKYWMAGITHSYPTPLGASQLSFNDSQQDGDWPDPFHVEGMRDLPDLIDMTSDLINGRDEYDSSNHGTTTSSGTKVVKRIMQSGSSVQLGLTYTGVKPHMPTTGHNDWHPSGGEAYLTGQWYVTEVKKVTTALLVRDLQTRLDGTVCVNVPGSGEVTMPLQLTNHPSGLVYRFPSAYRAGTTRVYLNGSLLQLGVDYFETDPAAGYITLADNEASGSVTGTFWIGGEGRADLGDFSLIMPVLTSVTSSFGPQASLWPPYGWHGTYYEHFHNGVDFAAPAGQPVYAAAGGSVHHETQSAGGIMIHIYHSINVRTTYAHLSSRVAAHGAIVVQGQLIGYTGDSGIVTGAHLHWGLVVDGIPEDPLEYV